jgi:hypothetical protein
VFVFGTVEKEDPNAPLVSNLVGKRRLKKGKKGGI